MVKKILLSIALCAIVCTAQLQLELSHEDIISTTTPNLYQDTLFYFSPELNGATQGTISVLDINVPQSYLIVSSGAGTGSFSGLEGQLKTVATTTPDKESVEVDSQLLLTNFLFTDVSFVAAPKINYNLNNVKAGFGLALPTTTTTTNFVSALIASKDKRINANQFSFYFSDPVSLVVFGEPNLFFAQDALVNFPQASPAPANWELSVSNLAVNSQNVFTSTVAATFDTTSEFLTVDSATYTAITSQLQEAGVTIVRATTTAYDTVNCQAAIEHRNLAFDFTFKQGATTKTINVLLGDLFKSKFADTNGNCPLLLVKGAATTTSWTLGTAFLRGAYVSFSLDDYSISLANVSRFTAQSRTITSVWQGVFIAIGVSLFLIALASTLTLLKPLGYVPVATAVTTQKVPEQASPRKLETFTYTSAQPLTVVPQQQQIAYSAQPTEFLQQSSHYTNPTQSLTAQEELAYSAVQNPVVLRSNIGGASPTRATQVIAQPGESIYRSSNNQF